MFLKTFFTLALLSSPAQSQKIMQYDYYDSETENIYKAKPTRIEYGSCWYCMGSAPEPVELNLLKIPVNVVIPKGTNVFNHPNYAQDPTQVPGYFSGYQGNAQCELGKNTPARLLHINQSYAAIELRSSESCASVGPGAGQPKIIFVDAKAVKYENEITEATTTDKEDCENCKKSKSLDKIDLAAIDDTASAEGDVDDTLAAMAQNPPDKLDSFKNREDQEHYLKCWATKEGWENYQNGYRQLFEKAGDTFQVSFDPKYNRIFAFDNPSEQQKKSGDSHLVRVDPRALKCLSLIESGFDKTKVSGTGAQGIAQLTHSNVKEINCLLNGCILPAKKDPNETSGKIKKPTERKYAPWARKRWDSFIKSVKRDLPPKDYPELYKNSRGKQCPDTIKDPDLDSTCPILAIAATSIYQIKSELGVLGVTEEIMTNETVPMSEKDRDVLQLAIASTHNAGETISRKSAQAVSKMSDILVKMVKSTDRTKEVSGYIKKIENCLSDKNFKPPWDPPSKADLKKAAVCAKTAPSAQ